MGAGASILIPLAMKEEGHIWFGPDFLRFFRELAANNHKEWFQENRKRYENSVKKPFEQFVKALIEEIRRLDPEVQITPSQAIFRINRDIRFSPDKAPYKLDRSAVISSAGRKDHSVPGFYLSFGPETTFLGGGAYFLKSDQLQLMREHIARHPRTFSRLLEAPEFTDLYDSLRGEQNKRLPKELKEAAEDQPLLYNKQFYYMAEYEPERIVQPGLLGFCLEHYRAALPLQRFLAEAL